MRWGRRVVVYSVVLAVAVGTLVAFWPHGPRPAREAFDRVREGMTYEEVCATVGGAPGDAPGAGQPLSAFWTASDGSSLSVDFDDGGRVARITRRPAQ